MGVLDGFAGSKFECLLFDLDDTLYPMSSGINSACRKNIEEFMLQHLQIEQSEVPAMCLNLYKEYGTTMAGLKAIGYEFDNDEFHSLVHGTLPYDILQPDHALRNLLLSMPQRKIVFTNADMAHATKALGKLGVEDCFEGIICFETLNPRSMDRHGRVDVNAVDDGFTMKESDTKLKSMNVLCKPDVEAIQAAIRIVNVDPDKILFFDDSARNIASGKAVGLHTVIVGSSKQVDGADYALSSIHNIKQAIPHIWESQADQPESAIRSPAVKTAVHA